MTKVERTKARVKLPAADEPAATPTPTPSPTPAPPPPPALAAQIDQPDGLTVTGTGWAPGDCAGTANPVTITLAHSGKPPETLGTATPDSKGAFAQSFKPVAASSGDVVSATQSACDGSSLSQTAKVP